MYHLTIAEAREFVRARLDELSVETPDILSETIDDANLDQTVDTLLEEAITFVHLAAPASLMEGQVITPSDFMPGGVAVVSRVLEFDLGNLRSTTPFKECLRMVSFQCGDSDVKLTQAVYEDSPQARMQRNTYIQGQPDSPVLVQMDDSPDFHPHYKYYTTNRSLADLNFAFRFFPRPAIQADANAISASSSVSRFQANGGSGVLTITSSGSWQIIRENLPSWITFATYSGTTDPVTHKSTVNFSIAANGSDERSATIYVSNGVNTATCRITQSQSGAGPTPTELFLRVESSNLSDGTLSVSPFSTSETVKIRVYATKDLAVTGVLSDGTYFNVPQASGVGKGNDYFEVPVSAKSANEGESARTATLTFSAPGVQSVAITLKQDIGLIVTPSDTCVLPANGGNGNVNYTVRAGAPWTITQIELVNGISPLINGALSNSGPKGQNTLAFTALQNIDRIRIVQWRISCGYSQYDKIVTTTQDVATINPYGLSVSPGFIEFHNAGEQQTLSVTAVGSEWAMGAVPAWINVVRNGNTLTITSLDGQTHEGSLYIYLTDDEENFHLNVPVKQTPPEIPLELSIKANGLTYKNVPYQGGTFTAVLRSSADWNISTDGGFITVNSALSGTGSDQDVTVSFTVPPYDNGRDGKIIVTAANTRAELDIFQAVRVDSIEVTERESGGNNYIEMDSESGAYGFYVYSTRGWSASTLNSWITPTGNSWSNVPSGNQARFFRVSANPGTRREGKITIVQEVTGKTIEFNIYQAGDTPSTEYLNVSCDLTSCDGMGVTGAKVAIRSNISWAVSEKSTGIDFDGGSANPSGVGNKDLTFSVQSSRVSRTLSFKVGNSNYPSLTKTITIEQSGSSVLDVFNMSPNGTKDVAANVTSLQIAIDSSVGWTASVEGTGASLDHASGTGDKIITVSFPANASTTDTKTYTVTVTPASGTGFSAKTLVITQARATVQYSLSTSNSSVALDNVGNAQTITVNSSHTWKTAANSTWLTVSPTTGQAGDGQTVRISATSNPGTRREGSIRFYNDGAYKIVTVSQAGDYAEKQISALPSPIHFSFAGGSKTFKVFASGAWSLGALGSGLSASPTSGTGDLSSGETVTLTATANAGAARSWSVVASLTGGGADPATVEVTQDAEESLVLSNMSAFSVPNSGGYGSVDIESNTDWYWEATDGVSVGEGQSGTGNGKAWWFVGPNPSNAQRVINLTFKTRSGLVTDSKTITQAAGQFVVKGAPGDTSPLSVIHMGAAAGSYTFYVWSNDAWEIQTKPDWITSVNPSEGSGADGERVDLAASENINEASRYGNLVLRQKNTGATVNISLEQSEGQIGGDSISLEAATASEDYVSIGTTPAGSQMVAAAGVVLNLNVDANCDWTVHDVTGSNTPLANAFMTFNPVSGTNDGSVAVTVGQNTGESPRVLRGMVTNAEGSARQYFWIVQKGTARTLQVTPANSFLSFTEDSLTYSLSILSESQWHLSIEYPSVSSFQWLRASVNQGVPNVPASVTLTGMQSISQWRTAEVRIYNDDDEVVLHCSAEPVEHINS